MSIEFQILGQPGEDNALLATVDTGQSRHPLLFDCGEGVLGGLKIAEVQAVEHLFFSHFHMDHVCGFDTFFRHNYNREGEPTHIWGPEGTIDVMHHRFQGYTWNLHANQPGEWRVNELDEHGNWVNAARFLTHDAFRTRHEIAPKLQNAAGFLKTDAYHVEAQALNHGSIPSMAYKLVEPIKTNVDAAKVAKAGLKPGPWLGKLSDQSISDEETIGVSEGARTLRELRAEFLIETPGQSLAYLTDFCQLFDDSRDSLIEWLRGTQTLVSEAQYLHVDIELARRNGHMTTRLVSELARDAGVERLILQHVSRRYDEAGWAEMLIEAREAFKSTFFPSNWSI